MDTLTGLSLIIFILGLLTGCLFFLIYSRLTLMKREQNLKKSTNLILNRAKSQANKIERQGKQKTKEWEEQAQKKLEKEINREREKIKNKEQQLKRQEEKLNIEMKSREEDFNKMGARVKKGARGI